MNQKLTVKWFLIILICYAIFSAWLAAKTWYLGQRLGCARATVHLAHDRLSPELMDRCFYGDIYEPNL